MKQFKIFTASRDTWETYQAISKVYSAAELKEKAGGEEGMMLAEAKGLLEVIVKTGAATAALAAPVEERKIPKAERRAAEEAAKQKVAEEKKAAAEKAAKAQKEAARQADVAPYAAIPALLTDPIAQAAWDAAIDSYVRSGLGGGSIQLTLGGGAKTREELVAALADWKGIKAEVERLGAPAGRLIKSTSRFSAPQDKAAKVGAEKKVTVGDTLDTRSIQANFILYCDTKKPSKMYVNVHVDQV